MSYTWLLYKLLNLLDHGVFTKYIKILKCPKRTAVYEQNFTKIMHALRRLDKFEAVLDVFGDCEPLRGVHEDGLCPLPNPNCAS